MIVDDDMLTREVLVILAEECGFAVESFSSGTAALTHLAQRARDAPSAILADMQMPDISGQSLAPLLRSTCGPQTLLVAMSGTDVPPTLTDDFDAFLLKPFTGKALCKVLADTLPRPERPDEDISRAAASLNQAVYKSLAQSMPREQLMQLYSMCLDDAERRLERMREAVAAADQDTFVRGAHSLKGGCGMLGALELAAIATQMEEGGLPPRGENAPFEQFMNASARLRRILGAQQSWTSSD